MVVHVLKRGVTEVLQRCYRGVTGVLQVCYRCGTGVLQGSYRGVTGVRGVTEEDINLRPTSFLLECSMYLCFRYSLVMISRPLAALSCVSESCWLPQSDATFRADFGLRGQGLGHSDDRAPCQQQRRICHRYFIEYHCTNCSSLAVVCIVIGKI